MNLITRPSLEHIALVQVAAIYWNQHDIQTLVEEFTNSLLHSQWDRVFVIEDTPNEKRNELKKIEEKVLEKVSQLLISTTLKEKILCFIQPVGIQIFKWIKYHLECCIYGLGLPNKFCWTVYDTIDKQKTAEVYIKDEAMDITTRYKMACIYCLKDDIPELWYKLPESSKISFYKEENTEHSFQGQLLIFWWHYVREKANKKNNIKRKSPFFSAPYMFQCAAESGYKAATEYFLHKVDQREELLLKAAISVKQKYCKEIDLDFTKPHKDHYGEVLSFLLSQMNDDHLLQIFKDCTFAIVQCLLDWPCQNLLVETASRLWNFLPNLTYHHILMKIIDKISLDNMYYNYQKMFRKLWQQTPHSHKSSFINDNDCIFYALFNLLQNKDKESIELIFQDITLNVRNKLIFSDYGRYLFRSMIWQEDWSLIKFFVPLCISSKDEMMKFKQEFDYSPRWLQWNQNDIFVLNNNKVKEFFRILDEFICRYDKQKV